MSLHEWVPAPQLRRKVKPEPGAGAPQAFGRPQVGRGRPRRKGLSPSQGLASPFSPPTSQGSAPQGPFLKSRTGSRPPPTPYRGGHRTMPAAHRALWTAEAFSSPAHPPPSSSRKRPLQRPRRQRTGAGAETGPGRQARRPGARAPPSRDALTSTAFPAGPASAAIGGLRPHLRKPLFNSPGLGAGRCCVGKTGKPLGTATLRIPASRTGLQLKGV